MWINLLHRVNGVKSQRSQIPLVLEVSVEVLDRGVLKISAGSRRWVFAWTWRVSDDLIAQGLTHQLVFKREVGHGVA